MALRCAAAAYIAPVDLGAASLSSLSNVPCAAGVAVLVVPEAAEEEEEIPVVVVDVDCRRT